MLTEPALREWCRLEWPQRMCLQTIVFCFFLLVYKIIHFNEWSRLSGVEDQCLVTSLAVNLWTDSSWLLMVTALGPRLHCSCPGSFLPIYLDSSLFWVERRLPRWPNSLTHTNNLTQHERGVVMTITAVLTSTGQSTTVINGPKGKVSVCVWVMEVRVGGDAWLLMHMTFVLAYWPDGVCHVKGIASSFW